MKVHVHYACIILIKTEAQCLEFWISSCHYSVQLNTIFSCAANQWFEKWCAGAHCLSYIKSFRNQLMTLPNPMAKKVIWPFIQYQIWDIFIYIYLYKSDNALIELVLVSYLYESAITLVQFVVMFNLHINSTCSINGCQFHVSCVGHVEIAIKVNRTDSWKSVIMGNDLKSKNLMHRYELRNYFYLRQFWRRLCFQSFLYDVCLSFVCWFVFKITQKAVDGL